MLRGTFGHLTLREELTLISRLMATHPQPFEFAQSMLADEIRRTGESEGAFKHLRSQSRHPRL